MSYLIEAQSCVPDLNVASIYASLALLVGQEDRLLLVGGFPLLLLLLMELQLIQPGVLPCC